MNSFPLFALAVLLAFSTPVWAASAIDSQADAQVQALTEDLPLVYKMTAGAHVMKAPAANAHIVRTIKNYSHGYIIASTVAGNTTWYRVQSFDKEIEGWVKKDSAITSRAHLSDKDNAKPFDRTIARFVAHAQMLIEHNESLLKSTWDFSEKKTYTLQDGRVLYEQWIFDAQQQGGKHPSSIGLLRDLTQKNTIVNNIQLSIPNQSIGGLTIGLDTPETLQKKLGHGKALESLFTITAGDVPDETIWKYADSPEWVGSTHFDLVFDSNQKLKSINYYIVTAH